MRSIALLGEDNGHEYVIGPLIRRVAESAHVPIDLRLLSVRGGYGRVVQETKDLVRDVHRHRVKLPDLIVIATDANCHGLAQRLREIEDAAGDSRGMVVCAIPDPHIERWLLLDSAAFKKAVGGPCSAPDRKCERDRYKRQLLEEIRGCGLTPLLGGLEYAEDIVSQMDLPRLELADPSFGHFVSALRGRLNQWAGETIP